MKTKSFRNTFKTSVKVFVKEVIVKVITILNNNNGNVGFL